MYRYVCVRVCIHALHVCVRVCMRANMTRCMHVNVRTEWVMGQECELLALLSQCACAPPISDFPSALSIARVVTAMAPPAVPFGFSVFSLSFSGRGWTGGMEFLLFYCLFSSLSFFCPPPPPLSLLCFPPVNFLSSFSFFLFHHFGPHRELHVAYCNRMCCNVNVTCCNVMYCTVMLCTVLYVLYCTVTVM